MKIRKNFNYTVLYLNPGEAFDEGHGCGEYPTMKSAERFCRTCLESGERIYGYYVIQMHRKDYDEVRNVAYMMMQGGCIVEKAMI